MMPPRSKKETSTNGCKRKPNAECVVCKKPLYRRPYELAKVRHVACMEHRGLAQHLEGLTEAQKAGLALGSRKGTNHRTGYKHKESSKLKTKKANQEYWRLHPEQLKKRGEKTRAELHYNWKGGSTRLNVSIRRMTEHRRWMDAVKARDGKCTCGSIQDLEAHHITELAILITRNKVKNRADARDCEALWDLSNGITKCRKCHYAIHGRRYED